MKDKINKKSFDRSIHTIVHKDSYDKMAAYCEKEKITVSKFIRVAIERMLETIN